MVESRCVDGAVVVERLFHCFASRLKCNEINIEQQQQQQQRWDLLKLKLNGRNQTGQRLLVFTFAVSLPPIDIGLIDDM